MATNPYFTQFHTQRFSFIGSPQQRDGTYTKDQRFVNLYPELITSPISDGKKYYLKKRPGASHYFQLGTAAEGRGCFFWQGHLFSVVGNRVYQDETFLQTLATSTGPVGFCEFRTDSVNQLIMCDGINGYIGVVGGFTQITDPNFPTPHIPNPVFLDGYIFLAHALTQTIHNSTLQFPNSWPADGFIDAEMYADDIVALTKAQNYLVAVGRTSIEFFYDNANATGSPLQRNAPAVSQFGCPAPQSVNQTESEVILIGTTGNGGLTIWEIKGFQPAEIADAPVREALDLEGAAIAGATANTIQCNGHKWYVLNLYGNHRTFVYDFDEKMWHEWTSGPGQDVFLWKWMTDSTLGYPLMLSYSTSEVATLQAINYTDLGQPIVCSATTVKLDFDTIMRKRFYRLSLIGDSPNGNTPVPVTVQWSDDDYTTFSPGATLQLNSTYPTITQLGYGRRRAFKFTYQQPYPLRLESFEVDIIQEVRR